MDEMLHNIWNMLACGVLSGTTGSCGLPIVAEGVKVSLIRCI